jgi:leucyl-tRNA synthetase
MSKSRGNVVTPDEVVERYGADTLRVYLLFMAPFERNVFWDEEGIVGADRFLQRVWRLCLRGTKHEGASETASADDALRRATHKTIRRVTDDIEAFKFNTALAALMEFANKLWAALERRGPSATSSEAMAALIRLLAPFVPHIAEELWSRVGGDFSVHQQPWPTYDPALTVEATNTLVLQVNGKVRDRIVVPAGTGDDEARQLALASERVRSRLNGRVPEDVIVVPGRLVNVVVR